MKKIKKTGALLLALSMLTMTAVNVSAADAGAFSGANYVVTDDASNLAGAIGIAGNHTGGGRMEIVEDRSGYAQLYATSAIAESVPNETYINLGGFNTQNQKIIEASLDFKLEKASDIAIYFNQHGSSSPNIVGAYISRHGQIAFKTGGWVTTYDGGNNCPVAASAEEFAAKSGLRNFQDITPLTWHTLTARIDTTTGTGWIFYDGVLMAEQINLGSYANMMIIKSYNALEANEVFLNIDNFVVKTMDDTEGTNTKEQINTRYEGADGWTRQLDGSKGWSFTGWNGNTQVSKGKLASGNGSSAVRFIYPASTTSNVRTFRINNLGTENSLKVISFDFRVLKPANFMFALRNSSWGFPVEAMVSENGYIGLAQTLNSDNQGDAIRAYFAKAKDQQSNVTDVEVSKWYNVKLVADASTNKSYMYVNDTLIGQQTIPWNNQYNITMLDITSFNENAAGEGLLEIDNLKAGSIPAEALGSSVQIVNAEGEKVTSFTAEDELSVKVTVSENNATEMKPIITYAFYKADGTLIDVKGSVKTIGAYGALDTTMNIEAIPAETKTIKAYVWNSVENITPLCQNSVATLAVQ